MPRRPAGTTCIICAIEFHYQELSTYVPFSPATRELVARKYIKDEPMHVCGRCVRNWVESILQMRTPWDKSEWGDK